MMRCIIIDDEPLAIDLLNDYCSQIPFIEVVATFTNPLMAIATINQQHIDLIFTDVDMPQINGVEFINLLDKKPLVIFTTAYSQYAIQGFELNAVDYLVKPISNTRFLKAVLRAKDLIALKNENHTLSKNTFSSSGINDASVKGNYIFVKSEYESIKVDIDDIKYIQGLKDYLKIHIKGTNKPILTLSSFKDILEKVAHHQFLRVHRSFAINVNYIKSVQRNKIIIDDVRIPIGENFKKDFIERVGL
ncbi:LytR/AlgR family response regulator transcription factor [Zhouia sp. PK063]|uniref:LytR/AlgR family response regulator transcription factor n=1 Tax=Zhouia sp. PK063 TaxID=3373602 RepID=UPI0037A6E620